MSNVALPSMPLVDQRLRGRELGRLRRRGGDGAVGAVGGDEVDQRLDVLQLAAEVRPAGVWLELRFAGLAEELRAHQVQRRDAGVAAAGDVQRGKVERQAEQVVLQRAGDELVDLVADLVDHAQDDVGRRVAALPSRRRHCLANSIGLVKAWIRPSCVICGWPVDGSITGLPSAPST